MKTMLINIFLKELSSAMKMIETQREYLTINDAGIDSNLYWINNKLMERYDSCTSSLRSTYDLLRTIMLCKDNKMLKDLLDKEKDKNGRTRMEK